MSSIRKPESPSGKLGNEAPQSKPENEQVVDCRIMANYTWLEREWMSESISM